jgi:hypothetical protein
MLARADSGAVVPLSLINTPVTVTIGGKDAMVDFQGARAGVALPKKGR